MKLCVAFLIVALSLCEASVIYPQRTPQNRRQRLTNAFVVGGTETTIAQYPHHLGLLDLTWGGYICGASNVSPRHAISAAHCLEFDVPAEFINLWGGSTSRLTGGTIFLVERYVNHPNYNTRTLDNDIAILFVDVSTPLSGVPHVQAIPLPPVCNAACCGVCVAGNDVIVTGWGIYNVDTRQLPENLQRLDKAIFPQGQCNSVWGGITSRMFCTVAENGKDSCNGDSGSAIIRDGVQQGVVSFGSEVCGDGSAPAVYVRVEDPMVRNWINAQTGL